MDLQSRHWQSLYGRREWGWRTTPKFFRQFGVFAYTQAKNERYPLSLYYHIFNLHSNTIIMLKRMKRKRSLQQRKMKHLHWQSHFKFQGSFIRSRLRICQPVRRSPLTRVLANKNENHGQARYSVCMQ